MIRDFSIGSSRCGSRSVLAKMTMRPSRRAAARASAPRSSVRLCPCSISRKARSTSVRCRSFAGSSSSSEACPSTFAVSNSRATSTPAGAARLRAPALVAARVCFVPGASRSRAAWRPRRCGRARRDVVQPAQRLERDVAGVAEQDESSQLAAGAMVSAGPSLSADPVLDDQVPSVDVDLDAVAAGLRRCRVGGASLCCIEASFVCRAPGRAAARGRLFTPGFYGRGLDSGGRLRLGVTACARVWRSLNVSTRPGRFSRCSGSRTVSCSDSGDCDRADPPVPGHF